MAMTRVTFRDRRLNARTRDMILAAEKILGWKLTIVQGSYNSGVAASAGTHDGGGAVDFSVRGLTNAQKAAAVAALRRVGFAAWYRTVAQGGGSWSTAHIHAIAVGDPELSRGAKYQVSAYKSGLNGLASRGKDDGPRQWVGVTWEKYAAAQKAAAAKAEDEKTKPVFHTWCLNYAAKGRPISHMTLAEARQFIAFARALGAISTYVEGVWLDEIAAKDYATAGRVFLQAIRSVQAKGKVPQDGLVGPVTGAFIDNYGYRIIYNG